MLKVSKSVKINNWCFICKQWITQSINFNRRLAFLGSVFTFLAENWIMLGFGTLCLFYCLWVWAIFSLKHFSLGGGKTTTFSLEISARPAPPNLWPALPGTLVMSSPWLRKAFSSYINRYYYYSSYMVRHDFTAVLVKWHLDHYLCVGLFGSQQSRGHEARSVGLETWQILKLQCISC